jgi:hypothetical protein
VLGNGGDSGIGREHALAALVLLGELLLDPGQAVVQGLRELREAVVSGAAS